MKKYTTLLVLLISMISSIIIFSQSLPQTINYQGVLKDAAGVTVANGDYNITFKIYDVSSAGTALWTETKLVNVVDGIINTKLGSIAPITLPFDNAYWLGVTIAAGSELTPRTELASVPYSFISMNVPDESLTANKISDGQVVKSLNSLKDNVNLVAGTNISITPSGNDLTINALGGSGTIGGSGTTNYIPKFINEANIGNSVIFENSTRIGLNEINPNYSLTINSSNTAGLGLKIYRLGGVRLLLSENITDDEGWAMRVFASKLHFARINVTGAVLTNALTVLSGGNVGIGTEDPTTKLHINGTSPSLRLVDGTQAAGKILVSDANGNATWQDNSRYWVSGLLNNSGYANLTSTYSKMGDFITFTKNSASSSVEVYMNSRVYGGTFAGGASAVQFEIRIDNVTATISNRGVVLNSGNAEFISIMAVFTGLSAGSHTISVWARTNTGTSTDALLDPSGWGGKIIAKETF
jgi:hypothetical protein